MHDLDELRRRLWLALMVGAVGCDASETKPAEPSKTVAHDDDDAGTKGSGGETQPITVSRKPGGMSSVVNGAVASAEATAKANKEAAAAEKAAFAALTCDVVIDRRKAKAGAAGIGTADHDCPAHSDKGLRLDVGATGLLRNSGDDDNCCYEEIHRVVKGRPYTVDGTHVLPDFGVRCTASRSALRTGARRRVAAGWLHDAREELASVAAFERAALELATAGAPRGLIDACSVAAAQEQRHATLCLSIAEEFAERPLRLGSPPAVEPRSLSLLSLLIETFDEGCAGEAIASAIARQSAHRASDRIRLALLEIATDEAEHAALAWQTLVWGLPRLTVSERVDFFVSAAVLRVAQPASFTGNAGVKLDPANGRMTPTVQTQVAADVWAHVIGPLLDQATAL